LILAKVTARRSWEYCCSRTRGELTRCVELTG
jgi:hypothetical protein